MSHLARDGLVECFEIAQADRQHRKYVASTRPTKSRRNCKHWSHWSYCTKNIKYFDISAVWKDFCMHTCKTRRRRKTLSLFCQCWLYGTATVFSSFDILRVSGTTVAEKMALAKQVAEIPKNNWNRCYFVTYLRSRPTRHSKIVNDFRINVFSRFSTNLWNLG